MYEQDDNDPLVWCAQISEDCPHDGGRETFMAYLPFIDMSLAFELTWRKVKTARQVILTQVLSGAADHSHDIHASLYRVRASAAIAMAEGE